MQIMIDIPDHEIPEKQDIISVDIHFIDGEVCECDYGFQVLQSDYAPHEMTDREKFCKLFDELGIEYNITEGSNIQLDPLYVDGAEDFYIDFWDGEDYPDGKFKEFMVYGDAELEGGHHD